MTSPNSTPEPNWADIEESRGFNAAREEGLATLARLACLLRNDQEDQFLELFAQEMAQPSKYWDLNEAAPLDDEFPQDDPSLAREAARRGSERALRALLDAGADPDAQSAGSTPLNIAIASGHARCARLLLERGAKPEGPGWQWRSRPLAAAAWVGNIECCLLLLEAGADPLALNHNKKTAAQAAREGSLQASKDGADAIDAWVEAKALESIAATATSKPGRSL